MIRAVLHCFKFKLQSREMGGLFGIGSALQERAPR